MPKCIESGTFKMDWSASLHPTGVLERPCRCGTPIKAFLVRDPVGWEIEEHNTPITDEDLALSMIRKIMSDEMCYLDLTPTALQYDGSFLLEPEEYALLERIESEVRKKKA